MNNNLKPSFALPPDLAATLRRSMSEGSRLMGLATQRMREQHAALGSVSKKRG